MLLARLQDYPPAPPGIDQDRWQELCDLAWLELQLEFLDLVEERGAGPFEDEIERQKACVDPFDYELALRGVIQQLNVGAGARHELWVPAALRFPMIHARIQLPVGQGGFHMAGLQPLRQQSHGDFIDPYDFPMLWIYDCGSIPREHVDASIDDFLALRTSKMIDFLFLSHLDLDHICGVSKLLDRTVRGMPAGKAATARTIVMPYLDDAERTIALARACSLHGPESVEGFVGQAIEDPVGTFTERGAERVVLVGSSEDEAPPDGFDPVDPPSLDGDGEDGMSWKIDEWPEGEPARCWQGHGRRALVLRGGAFAIGRRAHQALWQLVPYVVRPDPADVALFKMACEAQLGWKRGEFDRFMKPGQSRQDVVAKDRMKLARAYEYAFGDKNLTSLSLYSGPAEPRRTWARWLRPWGFETEPARVSWLSTGDAHLETDAAIDALERHYGPLLDQVSTYVVPHHGSIENSNPKRLPTHAQSWVVCADPSHDWAHPADAIVNAIKVRGQLRHVRADAATEFKEVAILGWR